MITRRLHTPARPRQGMTLMEMVVAITIVLIIIVGVVAVFIELLRSHDEARARMEATANARAAMEILSLEIKRAENTSATLTFVGTTGTGGQADFVDNDQDGDTDEEIMNGADDDGDHVQPGSDVHALIQSGADQYAERPVFYQQPDLDDRGIDEDLGGTTATLEFDTFDAPGEPLDRRVRFYIGNDPDGIPNTLMREVSGTDPVTSAAVVTSGPICYNVVSFGALFWNHGEAKNPATNPWSTDWPPTTATLTATPSTVYLHISVYAGTPLSLREVQDEGLTAERDTVTLNTAVNVEAVLADPTYVAQRTPVLPVPVVP